MPGLNTKSYYTGVVDNNDLAYVIERFGNPRRVLPAPISRFKIGEHKGKPKINPHVSSFLMKGGRTVSVFHIKPVYYLHVNREWRPLSEVTTYHGNRKLILNNKWEQIEPWYLRWLMKRCELIGGQVLIPWRFDNVPVREGQEIYFTVTTVFPDPDPETTSVDGRTVHSGDGTWASIRGGAGTAANDSIATSIFTQIKTGGTQDNWNTFEHGIFLFDTSSIDDGDTVSAADMQLYVTARNDNYSQSISIATSAPASNTALVAGDFDSIGYIRQATDNTIAGLTLDAYNTWTFNATGRGNISKTGVSKFAVICSGDMDNSEPTWISNTAADISGNYADVADTTSDPKLTVTHSAAPTTGIYGFNMTGFWGA